MNSQSTSSSRTTRGDFILVHAAVTNTSWWHCTLVLTPSWSGPSPPSTTTHRIPAYNNIFARLAAVGEAPNVHIMDNECSEALQRAIATNKCKLQLVPPHVHRRNAAKRAIRTFKDHFLAILAGAAPNYPADRWDLLLPHAELTLNLLRPPATGLGPSAWNALFGHFNFDATPIAPAGCAVQMHHKPALRRSWDYRSTFESGQ